MEDRQMRVVKILEDISGRPFVGAENTDLFETGYLDSFTITNLALEIELQYGFAFDFSDISEKSFRTISSIVTLIEHQKSNKTPKKK